MGFDAFYRSLMPGLAGREKREFFNNLALVIVATAALTGALIGLELGISWAVVGGTAGFAAGMW